MGLALRLAMRQIAHRKLVTITTSSVLAVGLALNASFFAIIDGVLFKALPYAEADRLTMVYGSRRSGTDLLTQPLPEAAIYDLRDPGSAFESVAAFGSGDLQEGPVGESTSAVQHRQVSPELFDVLGVRPILGRTLMLSDASLIDPRNAVVGFEFWRSRLGQDGAVLGKTTTISGKVVRIVGVMPKGFDFPSAANLWTALVVPPEQRSFASLYVVGRLRTGLSVVAARELLAQRDDSVTSFRMQYQLKSLEEVLAPLHTFSIGLMFLASGFALAITWIQAAMGQLAATASQGRAVAIQIFLGASRLRLASQFATTGALMASASLAAAFVVAPAITAALVHWLPSSATAGHDIAVDLRALGAAALVSAGGVVAFATAPSIAFKQSQLSDLIGGRASLLGSRPMTVGWALIFTQIVLTCCVAHLAALASHSVMRISRADLGFQPRGLMAVSIPPSVIPLRERGRLREVIDSVTTDLESGLPGATIARSDSQPFAQGGVFGSVQMFSEDAPTPILVKTTSVSPNYFRTVGIPILTGRAFQVQDADAGTVMVNSTLVEITKRQGSMVGSEILLAGVRRRVIGVVGAIKDQSPEMPSRPMVYTLAGSSATERVLLLRVQPDDSEAVVSTARRSLSLRTGAEPQAFDIRSVEDTALRSIALHRARAWLLSLISVITIALTAVGIYTAGSYLVSDRQHDIGVRLSLGAPPSRIRAWVIRRTVMITTLGVAIGTTLGVAAAQMVRTMLFEVAPFDLASIVGVAAILLGVAVAAAGLPAFKASRLDPLQLLREV